MTTVPGGPGARAGVGSVTRPNDTTAYAIGDLIANTGAAVPIALPTAKSGLANRVRLKVNDTAWKAATIRAHFFRDVPTVAVNDNGVLNAAETYAFTESNYLGYVEVTLSQQTSDGYVKGFAAFQFLFETLTGASGLSALLEARTAVTPAASKVFTLALELEGE